MIVCSCNGFSDHDVRGCVADADCRLKVSDVYAALGHRPNCGVCARTIHGILSESREDSCAVCPVRAQIEASQARISRRLEAELELTQTVVMVAAE